MTVKRSLFLNDKEKEQELKWLTNIKKDLEPLLDGINVARFIENKYAHKRGCLRNHLNLSQGKYLPYTEIKLTYNTKDFHPKVDKVEVFIDNTPNLTLRKTYAFDVQTGHLKSRSAKAIAKLILDVRNEVRDIVEQKESLNRQIRENAEKGAELVRSAGYNAEITKDYKDIILTVSFPGIRGCVNLKVSEMGDYATRIGTGGDLPIHATPENLVEVMTAVLFLKKAMQKNLP